MLSACRNEIIFFLNTLICTLDFVELFEFYLVVKLNTNVCLNFASVLCSCAHCKGRYNMSRLVINGIDGA